MEPLKTSAQNGVLSHYHRAIRTYPYLSAEAEQALCSRWHDHCDLSAAHQLVGSHLRLVTKVAKSYAGYGLPAEDLIGEGHVGLMRAICRFEPDHGARFATYAVWWIRAEMQSYILRNWSLVRLGTTASQRKLFFNLRSLKSQLRAFDSGELESNHVTKIADILHVPRNDVMIMDHRLTGTDCSLNAPIGDDKEGECQAWLADDGDNQELVLADREETAYRKSQLYSALGQLTNRERHIVVERRLKESPTTLKNLSESFGLSCERIRQIETQALKKLRRSLALGQARA